MEITLKFQSEFGEDEWKGTLECIRRIKSEGDGSKIPAVKKMVEQELVHAIEAVLNSKKKLSKSESKVGVQYFCPDFGLSRLVHVGTKMKHSQIGRFPSDRCRNDPHYPIGSHDVQLQFEVCSDCLLIATPTQSLKLIFLRFRHFQTLRGPSDE